MRIFDYIFINKADLATIFQYTGECKLKYKLNIRHSKNVII